MPIRLACQFFLAQSNIYSFLSCFAVYHLLAITITFSQTTYDVDEDDGPAQPVLVLSNPSATAFTVRVREVPRTATSKHINNN